MWAHSCSFASRKLQDDSGSTDLAICADTCDFTKLRTLLDPETWLSDRGVVLEIPCCITILGLLELKINIIIKPGFVFASDPMLLAIDAGRPRLFCAETTVSPASNSDQHDRTASTA